MAKAIIATKGKCFTNAAATAVSAELPSTAQSAPIDREALVKLALEFRSMMKDVGEAIKNVGEAINNSTAR